MHAPNYKPILCRYPAKWMLALVVLLELSTVLVKKYKYSKEFWRIEKIKKIETTESIKKTEKDLS